MKPLYVPELAYPYLIAQRGALDAVKGDRKKWTEQYCEVIQSEFDLIQPYLPVSCASILDVGSGLGGINAVLNEFYGGQCRITLLDGIEDPPTVELHRQPFNDMSVARDFLYLNGVQRLDYIDARHPTPPDIPYDLIISFKSWCFHVEPQSYLELVRGACHAQTTVILDVRLNRADWLTALESVFTIRNSIYRGTKFETFRLVPK